jgi:hypothetical protein
VDYNTKDTIITSALIGVLAVVILLGGGMCYSYNIRVEQMRLMALESCVNTVPAEHVLVCAAAKGDLPETMAEGGLLINKPVDDK